MKVYCLILCCVLFTSAACLSIPDFFPEHGNGSLPEVAQGDKCKCSNGKCVTDNRGNEKCICKPGYSHQDEFTCKPCDCGSKGKCIFTLQPKSRGGFTYEKKCICDLGSAEKDGKCIHCYCGENSACEFNGEEKNCYCIEGYAEKEGVCTKCDCGFYGQCEFQRGNKICTCDEGHLEYNGTCEECDCGDHGTCYFLDGEKYCKCEKGYRENEGKCEECDCGDYSVDCYYSRGVKECHCEEKFSDLAGKCVECDCGPNGIACRFINYEKICKCSEGYVQKGLTCDVGCSYYNKCENGGICEEGFCKCRKGTSGEFCEVIDECDRLCPKQQDIRCVYDITREQPICECLDHNLRFDPERQQCHNTCDERARCRNGGECTPSGFCKCRVGTEGDFCENIPECRYKNCGTEADCAYDAAEERAVCQCKSGYLSFDSRDRKCKRTCQDDTTCENNGKCTGISNLKFCECMEGTEGPFCEDVVGCRNKDCGKEADCVYDPSIKSATCLCKNQDLKFDDASGKCKKTCQDDATCKNHGKCTGISNLKFCDCLEGTEGQFCEDVVGCRNKDCGKEADCIYDASIKSATCLCKNQDLKFDDASGKCKRTCDGDSSCNNGGKCFRRFCDCLEGTSGDLCETVPECNVKDCGYDARCVYNLDRRSAVCVCKDEKYSFDEADRTCKRGCTVGDECNNGGTCTSKGFGRFCDCLPGTRGDWCETVNDCKDGRVDCKGDGYCVFDVKRRKGVCECSDHRKRYDILSEKCKLTCYEDATCHNGGLCMHHGDHLFCECKVGTSGNLCETVEDCQRGLCGNNIGVECVYDAVKEGAFCKCRNAEKLFDPESKTCKACDCGGNSISCRYENGRKVCVCQDGYDARNGTCQKVKCTERSCHNGKCQVIGEKEVCSCYEGFTLNGDYCQKLNCSKTPCINGTCVVRNGYREECVCQAGYTLKDGACIRGACRIDTCFGGVCKIIEEELMCVCPKNYSLQGIGCFATVCKKHHCFGGWCVVNEDKEEICTCHEGYILVNDVCKKILCKKPCFGGQCKFVDGKEECICPPGYFIFEGVCRRQQSFMAQYVTEEKGRTEKNFKDLL